jgi:hypothetical protein
LILSLSDFVCQFQTSAWSAQHVLLIGPTYKPLTLVAEKRSDEKSSATLES